ncbi:hypothetical protein B1A99_08320 [Cohnella sp. CIP 111063]|uniref:hypothetical protein n=1 Tax=unclassified Cohnella TaxID=2636738 RepID=UPI000B8C09AF|nr:MULTISPECIES: hypothetical protein [unclassified Cohnella]OXS60420.1 hypothetical protein B1A99_08320 [Cohnella sp. CIP 111063]PRX73121.1 hypothetical protein B0G52_104221 [Cohnella sp. SGD-V74]
MKLYGMRLNPAFEGRFERFLEDNYVSIGYPGIGDLEEADKDEIERRLSGLGGYAGHELRAAAEEIHLFASGVRDGDYLLFADGDTVVLGDVGDYFYAESSDVPADGACHRRGVTWLHRIARSELNGLVQDLLDASGVIQAFPYPIQLAQLDRWLSPQGVQPPGADRPKVDDETIAEALEVLKMALRSDDPDRRERAAAAILGYAK